MVVLYWCPESYTLAKVPWLGEANNEDGDDFSDEEEEAPHHLCLLHCGKNGALWVAHDRIAEVFNCFVSHKATD